MCSGAVAASAECRHDRGCCSAADLVPAAQIMRRLHCQRLEACQACQLRAQSDVLSSSRSSRQMCSGDASNLQPNVASVTRFRTRLSSTMQQNPTGSVACCVRCLCPHSTPLLHLCMLAAARYVNLARPQPRASTPHKAMAKLALLPFANCACRQNDTISAKTAPVLLCQSWHRCLVMISCRCHPCQLVLRRAARLQHRRRRRRRHCRHLCSPAECARASCSDCQRPRSARSPAAALDPAHNKFDNSAVG